MKSYACFTGPQATKIMVTSYTLRIIRQDAGQEVISLQCSLVPLHDKQLSIKSVQTRNIQVNHSQSLVEFYPRRHLAEEMTFRIYQLNETWQTKHYSGTIIRNRH